MVASARMSRRRNVLISTRGAPRGAWRPLRGAGGRGAPTGSGRPLARGASKARNRSGDAGGRFRVLLLDGGGRSVGSVVIRGDAVGAPNSNVSRGERRVEVRPATTRPDPALPTVARDPARAGALWGARVRIAALECELQTAARRAQEASAARARDIRGGARAGAGCRPGAPGRRATRKAGWPVHRRRGRGPGPPRDTRWGGRTAEMRSGRPRSESRGPSDTRTGPRCAWWSWRTNCARSRRGLRSWTGRRQGSARSLARSGPRTSDCGASCFDSTRPSTT